MAACTAATSPFHRRFAPLLKGVWGAFFVSSKLRGSLSVYHSLKDSWLEGFIPNTRAAYRRDVRAVEALLSVSPERWTAGLFEGLVDRLCLSRGLSVRSAIRAAWAVKSLCAFLHRSAFYTADPCDRLRVPRSAGRRIPRYVSPADVRALIRAADPRDQAVIVLLYLTGLRVSEALKLPLEVNTDAENVRMSIIAKGGRPRAVVYPLVLHRKLVSSFRDRPGGSPLDCLVPLSRSQVWRIVHTASIIAGISPPLSPHSLRHAFATHAYESGHSPLSIRDTLGHSSTSTTELYIHSHTEPLTDLLQLILGPSQTA
jgi:site-specific recombinase XerD